ncbi:MAG: hypothetical protein H5U29_00090 [Pusillimonas sp.]|nr:hypothetical protein [Pusillimonas sp.]
MTNVKMPEPVAFYGQGLKPILPKGLDDLKRSDIQGTATLYDTPLITTTQAQAYADERVRESNAWQLIETAPKDGTGVLLWGPCCDTTPCFWALYDPEPYWCVASIEIDGDGRAVLRGEPTHWMNMPSTPA